MALPKDLTNQRFGKLIALYPLKNNQGRRVWKCQCDCGNQTEVPCNKLTSGHTKSCGCLKQKGPLIDETGKRYGRLVVLKRVSNHLDKEAAYWLCQCDCGNTTEVLGRHLRKGLTTSCGCYQRDCIKKTPNDLLGQRFGLLTVTNLLNERKNKKVMWECKCDCGNIVTVAASDLTSGHTKSCGCMTQSYGVIKITNSLTQNKIPFKQEVTFPDLIDKKPLRFDFGIYFNNSLVALIEFNGIQHFDKKNKFYSDIIKQHDKIKRDYCRTHNILLFDINYNDNLENKIQEVITWWNSLITI